MNREPLIILGSARKNSDTRFYVNFVFDGIQHTIIDLSDLKISMYNYEGDYKSDDDFNPLKNAMQQHSIIIFATPVYWYAMSAIMKNLFDRFTDISTIEKETGRKLKNKSVFLLAVGEEEKLPPGFEVPFQLTAEYFDMIYRGSIYFISKKRLLNDKSKEDKIIFLEKIKAISKENDLL